MPAIQFDTSYFTDPATGKFRLPAYTLRWKGLVQIRDLTAYKKDCFQGLSENAIHSFSLLDFERAHLSPEFEVESLESFINRFPEGCFNKGISKSALWDLLDLYEPFNSDYSKVDEKNDVRFPAYEIEDAIRLGLMERIDISADPEKFWSKLTKEELRDLGLEYNIYPQANKKKTIQKLLENNVDYPQVLSRPTPLLKEVYLNFVDLFIEAIRQDTIHFHPRLIKALWVTIGEANDRGPISEKIRQFLKAPYWMAEPYPAAGLDNWSNAAFTFQMPLPSKDPVFIREVEDPNDAPGGAFYLKGLEGSFDETYFKDGDTGDFRFPDYTDQLTGLVYVCDKTNYKKRYPTALVNFSLDEMEKNFVIPEWELGTLYDFIEDLPASYLKEGLSGNRLEDIFSNNYRYLNEENEQVLQYELLALNDPLINYGFFEKADQSLFKPARCWDAMSEAALVAICKENGIKPGKQKITMIWELIDHNTPFPLTWYKPTPALIQYYHSIIDLYIMDIRNSTDHFHPLYFAGLWEELKDHTYNIRLTEKVNEILAHPYWKARVYPALL